MTPLAPRPPRNPTPDAVRLTRTILDSEAQPNALGRRWPRTPDRPSERSERDAVAGRQAGAVAGAVAVLGSNTNSVSASDTLSVRAGRAKLYALRRYLWPISAKRVAKCGRCAIEDVGIGMRGGRARFTGLMRCGSVWACPVCSAAIRAERAAEIGQLYRWQLERGGEILMLTVTVAHGMGDDLRTVRQGVANAWRTVQQGRAWKELRSLYWLSGYVRALEVTHGRNGWHPHLHILLCLDKPLSDRARELMRRSLSARWQLAVSRVLGAQHRPNDGNGCNLRPAHEAEYIAKLGLEVADVHTKGAKRGNRTPWQIAAEYQAGNRNYGVLWQAYARGMLGARMLTWSRGLRVACGLVPELTDEEIVNAEDAEPTERVMLLPAVVWRELRDGPAWLLLDAAETGSRDVLLAEVERHLGMARNRPREGIRRLFLSG
ncbi:MAG: protein rep [Steroidobacteraceae bacterium]|nr:protein rep [Steroidobacteraceae bacterium]